jgi:uncharacterized protein (TIGR02001 family)
MLTSVRSLMAASMLAGCALAATPAFAQDAAAPAAPAAKPDFTVTGNVALVTDYRFRGVSLSGGDPAIQGGITLSHSSGLYVGTWSSSLVASPLYGTQELDLFGGWTGEVVSGLTLDAGLLYYVYPSGHVGDANYWEPYASLSGTIGPAKLKVGIAYDWQQKGLINNAGKKDDNFYIYSNLDVGVPGTPVTVSGHVGYTDGVLSPCYYCAGTSTFNDRTGWDYSIGASGTVFGPLSLGVSYVGVSGVSIDGYTDDTIVGTLTAAF